MGEQTYKPCHQETCKRFAEYVDPDKGYRIDNGIVSATQPISIQGHLETCRFCKYFERFNLFAEKET